MVRTAPGAISRGGARATRTRSSSREVMLQQTQVERVVPRYLAWLERWPTVEVARGGVCRRRDPRVAGARLQPARAEPAPRGAARRGRRLAGGPDRAAGRRAATRRPRSGASRSARTCCRWTSTSSASGGARATRSRPRPRRRSWISARRSASRASRAATRARSPTQCPSRGIRDEPARKQGPFEGSFRQRRAVTLRAVAESTRALSELDDEAVRSLERDGLVVVEDGLSPCRRRGEACLA